MIAVSHSDAFNFTVSGGERGEATVSFPQAPLVSQFNTDIHLSVSATIVSTAPLSRRFSASDYAYTIGEVGFDHAARTSFKSDRSAPVNFIIEDPDRGPTLLEAGTTSTVTVVDSAVVANRLSSYFGDGEKTMPVYGGGKFYQENGTYIYKSDPTQIMGTVSVSYEMEAPRIGTIQALTGSATIIRPGEGPITISVGDPVYFGDIIETGADGSVQMVFDDDTQFAIGDGTRLTVDEYIYDPNPSEQDRDGVSLLRGIFVFTSGLIGGADPDDASTDPPIKAKGVGFLGIRGDAAEIIKNDLLNNPQPEFGELGIWVETASPMTIATQLELPSDTVTLSFDYMFLEPDMQLTVTLGGTDVLSLASDPDMVDQSQSISLDIEWTELLTTLEFEVDGEAAGMDAIISGITLEGKRLDLTSSWYGVGGGGAEFVYLTSPDQLDDLIQVVIDENDAPNAGDDSYTVDAGDVLRVEAVLGLLANDTDTEGDTLMVEAADTAANGEIHIKSDGSFSYTPDAGFIGQEVLTYTVSDGIETATATVTIDVNNAASSGTLSRVEFVEDWGRDKAITTIHDTVVGTDRLRRLDKDMNVKAAGLTISAEDGIWFSPDFVTTAGKGIGVRSLFGDGFFWRESTTLNDSETLSFHLSRKDGLGDAFEVAFEFAEVRKSGEVSLTFYDDGAEVDNVSLDIEEDMVSYDLKGNRSFDRVDVEVEGALGVTIGAVEFLRMEADELNLV